jgi:hypothetical protein
MVVRGFNAEAKNQAVIHQLSVILGAPLINYSASHLPNSTSTYIGYYEDKPLS